MNINNKNTELENIDKKLHISMCSVLSLDNIEMFRKEYNYRNYMDNVNNDLKSFGTYSEDEFEQNGQ